MLLFDNNYLKKYSNFSKILFIYSCLINLNIQFNKFNNLFIVFHYNFFNNDKNYNIYDISDIRLSD